MNGESNSRNSPEFISRPLPFSSHNIIRMQYVYRKKLPLFVPPFTHLLLLSHPTAIKNCLTKENYFDGNKKQVAFNFFQTFPLWIYSLLQLYPIIINGSYFSRINLFGKYMFFANTGVFNEICLEIVLTDIKTIWYYFICTGCMGSSRYSNNPYNPQ